MRHNYTIGKELSEDSKRILNEKFRTIKEKEGTSLEITTNKSKYIMQDNTLSKSKMPFETFAIINFIIIFIISAVLAYVSNVLTKEGVIPDPEAYGFNTKNIIIEDALEKSEIVAEDTYKMSSYNLSLLLDKMKYFKYNEDKTVVVELEKDVDGNILSLTYKTIDLDN